MVEDWRQGQGGRMPGRWGLQAKMTASYVLVTAAAVVLVEAAIFGLQQRLVPLDEALDE